MDNLLDYYPFHVGRYDQRALEAVKPRIPTWEEVKKLKQKQGYKGMGKFMDCLFMGLYKPTLIATERDLELEDQQIMQLLHFVASLPEWRKIKPKAELDYDRSGIMTTAVGGMLDFESLPIPSQPADGSAGGGGEGEDGEEEGEPDLLGNEFRRQVVRVMQNAGDISDNIDTLQSLWGNEPGEHDFNDPETMLALSTELKDSNRLKLLAQLLGRMKNIMLSTQMQKTTYAPDEVVDVKFGNDLPKVLPREFQYLMSEDTELLFNLKYVTRQLMQYEKEGKEHINRGPIVCLVDISGSMGAGLGDVPNIGRISRLDWASAIALTLILLAKKQDRDFYICLFDTRIVQEHDSATSTGTSINDIIQLLSINPMGGTNFDVPLNKALTKIEESAYDKADMVFITDGDCYVSQNNYERFNAIKEVKDFKFVSVACAPYVPDILTELSDQVSTVESFTQSDKASKTIFSIGD